MRNPASSVWKKYSNQFFRLKIFQETASWSLSNMNLKSRSTMSTNVSSVIWPMPHRLRLPCVWLSGIPTRLPVPSPFTTLRSRTSIWATFRWWRTKVRLFSTVPSVSSFRRCTVRRASFLTMTKAKPSLPANICLPPALFLIAVPGWILNLTPKIWFMPVSTAAASCR